MKKVEYVLGSVWQSTWPAIEVVEHDYDAAFTVNQPTTGGFMLDGLEGTDHLSESRFRVRATLTFTIMPRNGISLMHRLWDGRVGADHSYDSLGDQSKLNDFFAIDDGKVSQGLFVSKSTGWSALKEFIEGNGNRSKEVNWINSRDLPHGLFPEPAPPDPLRWKKRT